MLSSVSSWLYLPSHSYCPEDSVLHLCLDVSLSQSALWIYIIICQVKSARLTNLASTRHIFRTLSWPTPSSILPMTCEGAGPADLHDSGRGVTSRYPRRALERVQSWWCTRNQSSWTRPITHQYTLAGKAVWTKGNTVWYTAVPNTTKTNGELMERQQKQWKPRDLFGWFLFYFLFVCGF